MKALGLAVLSCLIVVFAGSVQSQDKKDKDTKDTKDPNAKKIVGIWELTKSGGDLPVGTLIEFTTDSKLIASIKGDDGKVEKVNGTYTVASDKLTVKVDLNGTVEESATIKKLTEDALEIEDKDKKVDVFKRKTNKSQG
jgi:uncharacterized protein (TIGR03066 family)